jgi:hypothetical protein
MDFIKYYNKIIMIFINNTNQLLTVIQIKIIGCLNNTDINVSHYFSYHNYIYTDK